MKIYGFDALPEALVAVRDGTHGRHRGAVPGRAVAHGGPHRGGLRQGRHGARGRALVLLTPVVIGPDNLDQAERIGETELTRAMTRWPGRGSGPVR